MQSRSNFPTQYAQSDSNKNHTVYNYQNIIHKIIIKRSSKVRASLVKPESELARRDQRSVCAVKIVNDYASRFTIYGGEVKMKREEDEENGRRTVEEWEMNQGRRLHLGR
ncbi:hypothetical protein R6Q59_024506 [Mikania micrantha]|uniref:Uncharacterized protein n=1 Tax=Mikania micrantha TaxID=192012 RepID=A0A5N6LZH2_9ASTR|nr:hypothetical protein E3N88_34782 [Mikania micrantha]KAD5803238.1 hypothetical protein E3N88_14598 [Mikania micrantha]